MNYYFIERFRRKRRINAEKKIKKAGSKRRRGLLTFTLKYSSCRGAEGREKRGGGGGRGRLNNGERRSTKAVNNAQGGMEICLAR